MPLFRSKAEAKLAERGIDPARLPPGQYLTEKWPVLHAGSVPDTDLATWDFRIFGEVERPLTLTWDELQELPRTEITVDIHCVTRWSRFDTSFRGVHWSELAKLVEHLLAAENEPRLVLLGLDLRLRGEAEPRELSADALAQLRLGQEQEVVRPAAQHTQRGDHPRLRGEQERIAPLPHRERGDVVREHPLQVVLGVGPRDADVGSRQRRNARHPH